MTIELQHPELWAYISSAFLVLFVIGMIITIVIRRRKPKINMVFRDLEDFNRYKHFERWKNLITEQNKNNG